MRHLKQWMSFVWLVPFMGAEYGNLLNALSNTSVFESLTSSLGNLSVSLNQSGQELGNLGEQSTALANEFSSAELSLQNFTCKRCFTTNSK